jgi:hypothetical protein
MARDHRESAMAAKLPDVELQPDDEHEEQHAHLRQCLQQWEASHGEQRQRQRGRELPQHRGAEQNSREHLPDDARLAKTREQGAA